MNKLQKIIIAGFFGLALAIGGASAQPGHQGPNGGAPAEAVAQQGPDGAMAPGMGSMHDACHTLQAKDIQPNKVCFIPAIRAFVLIDSIDCAVDLVVTEADTMRRIGRYTTDIYKGRHDVKNIIRPQSVSVNNGMIVCLATAQDSSFVAVLGMEPNEDTLPVISRVDMSHASYAFYLSPCGRNLTVVGTNQQGYDFNIYQSPEGLEHLADAESQNFHYHVPKQAERIKASDPVGVGLTVVAVVVVFTALICVACIISLFGRGVARSEKRKAAKAAAANGSSPAQAVAQTSAEGDVYAAIAAAIHLYNEELHDEEDTIITIQKAERAWTPWNAKFYNMNHYFNNRK